MLDSLPESFGTQGERVVTLDITMTKKMTRNWQELTPPPPSSPTHLFQVANAGKNVSIQVYYETLCPDSADWIAYQLVPAYQRLGEHIRVDFFPFGKAKVKKKNQPLLVCKYSKGPRLYVVFYDILL